MGDYIYNSLTYPVLSVTAFLPLLGVLILLAVRNDAAARWVALAATAATFLVSLPVYLHFDPSTPAMQFVERYEWVPSWNLHYLVGIDGISIFFIFLSTLISSAAVLISWRSVTEKARTFYMMLLAMETIMIGIFISLNLFLFFLFWEVMLIPMFLLIGMWGGPNRAHASIKFLLFTLAGSIFMMVAIIVMYFMGGNTFDIAALSKVPYSAQAQLWLFLGFAIAFAVKVPLVPFHSWLPDAYTEAPIAATLIMSAVLAKMGTYGFLRIPLPMFPDAARQMMEPLIVLSLISIIYGAYLALAQTDFKRLIAYSSLSHMGFITLGIFALNAAGVQGAILQMVNHGVITGALFLCVGILHERTGTTDLARYGGLARVVPGFVTVFTLFALAGTGFPGMSYFIGEFLLLSGVFSVSVLYGAISIAGVVLGVVYMGWLYARLALFEPAPGMRGMPDLDARETAMFLPLLFLTVYLGVRPAAAIDFMRASVAALLERFGDSTAILAALRSLMEAVK